MEVVYPCCCGLDVHKKSITACVLWAEAKGKSRKEKKRFGTFTHDLLQLVDWLEQCGVTHVAMESTGVYWKPVWNILAEQFEVLLVNAQHIKGVPGRKTDQKDSEWIADLLQHGLLRGSFVPPQPICELRDLTRYRVSLVQEINRIANRIQKVLEDAKIKLASVATDALGTSGRAILEAMLSGEQDVAQLAEMSKGLLRNKIPELKLTLEGRVTEHHRFLLQQLYDHLLFTESKRKQIEEEIERRMGPFRDDVVRVHADLERFWMGHENETVGDGYSKMKEDVPFRLEQAETVDLGFALPPKIADVVRIVRKNETKPEVENAA